MLKCLNGFAVECMSFPCRCGQSGYLSQLLVKSPSIATLAAPNSRTSLSLDRLKSNDTKLLMLYDNNMGDSYWQR